MSAPLRSHGALVVAALALAGCAGRGASGAVVAPADRPAASGVNANSAGTAEPKTAKGDAKGNTASGGGGTGAAGAPDDAPDPTARPDWHRLDFERDQVYGTGADRAVSELLAGRAPSRPVIVAVIDGGVDTAHAQLAPVLWRNPREIAGNGVDDDRNGYVDDVRGWSMIPALPGDTGRYDTMELTRLYAACRGLAAGRGVTRPTDATCADLARDFAAEVKEQGEMAMQVGTISGLHNRVTAQLRLSLRTDTLTAPAVRAFTPSNAAESEAKRMWLRLADIGVDSAALADAKTQLAGSRFNLDTLFDPRGLPHDRNGSPDVQGPDPSHGTHVAGIIGAVGTGPDGARGIAPLVRIMALRAVPDGDERDEDVARAIRYAVDNGAQVINMSFGKGYSPGKPAVDSAVRYAAARGVLLVHAAGNDGEDTDSGANFPNRRLADGSESALWLEIGASSWKGARALAAEFSNFGQRSVDLFAPGEDVLSTWPGGGTKAESGTSMAAPVVSGVAALLLAYFPTLTPEQVRTIIVETVRPLGDLEVTRPGGEAAVRFGTLSRTGGLVDAYAAVRKAIALTSPVP